MALVVECEALSLLNANDIVQGGAVGSLQPADAFLVVFDVGKTIVLVKKDDGLDVAQFCEECTGNGLVGVVFQMCANVNERMQPVRCLCLVDNVVDSL